MFDKRAVDEYRSVTAPASLKKRLLDVSAARKPIPLRRITAAAVAVAACFALLAVAGSAIRSPSPVTLSTDGVRIAEHPQTMTASASARRQLSYTAQFTLECDDTITVEQADAGLWILSENADSTIPLNPPYTVDGPLTILWEIAEPTIRLQVNGQVFELTADTQEATVCVTELVQDSL